METGAQSQSQSPATLSTIPDELIIEILLKLPVKSLVRFKCVSPSWLSLISSSVFIKSHLKLNTKTNHQRLLLFRYISGVYNLGHCSLSSLRHQIADEVHVDYLPFEDFTLLVGYCDGLFCLGRGSDMFLWNPATLQYKKLPGCFYIPKRMDIILGGFSYDEVSDDYKVVTVGSIDGDTVLPPNIVMVYSVKTETWRRIGDFPLGRPAGREAGLFVNGKLHWSTVGEHSGKIVSLDLATEAYGLLEMPNFDRACGYHCLHSFEEGSLCLLCTPLYKSRVDVWVMKEYGSRESWCKLFELCLSDIARPICMYDKSELLWVDSGSDLMLGSTTKLFNVYNAFVFAESLVSPHGS